MTGYIYMIWLLLMLALTFIMIWETRKFVKLEAQEYGKQDKMKKELCV